MSVQSQQQPAKVTPGLPAPRVQVRRTSAPNAVQVQNTSFQNAAVRMVHAVLVTTHGLSVDVINNPAYKVQLELLRYVRRRRSTSGDPANASRQKAGFVHPSHGPAASGNGSHTHGGTHSATLNFGPAIIPFRLTEWKVTDLQQTVDVSQGCAAFMVRAPVAYRDPAGDMPNIQAVYPISNRGSNARMGRTYGYAGLFTPGYFKFRWSIIDPADPRGQRTHGPLSETVAISSEVFPFVTDVMNGGKATVTINPAYDPNRLSAWIDRRHNT